MDRREFEPEGTPRSRCVGEALEGNAEERRPRNAGDAGVTGGEVDPAIRISRMISPKASVDGEVVAAQAQHREAQDDAPERRQDAGERQQHSRTTRTEGLGEQA